MAFPLRIRRALRNLRVRLVISYVVIFGLLLVAVGFVFRYDLSHTIDGLQRELIEEDWNAAASFLDISGGQATWTVDPRKAEQSFIVDRLRRHLLIADADGTILEVSPAYRIFGVETAAEIKTELARAAPSWRLKQVQGGAAVLLRYGVFRSGNKSYLLVMGRRISEFSLLPVTITGDFFLALPLMLVVAALIGWLIAGRALAPVNELAEAAHRISGSNLHLRIPVRDAADELDKLIEAFNTMMARLESNFDQIRHFSTDASHELRTPITVIRGQLEVALMTARTPDEFREAISNALQDVDRLSNIVRALLLLSQAETGQIRIKFEAVSLTGAARELCEQFQTLAADSSVDLYASIPDLPDIRGDRTQIDRLLTNLLSNAVKYTGPGGSVRVLLTDTGSGVELAVSDSGIGIAPEHLPHIFERFYRVSKSETRKGLGLGLSFVSWIVKAHNGEITVSSQPGKGTTFVVRLPYWTPAAASAPQANLAEARQ